MTTYLSINERTTMTDATRDEALATIRPMVEAQIGAHLAAQANAVTRYGVEDAAGVLHDAFGPEDALATATDPDHAYGPQPRRAVWWVETRSPLLTLTPEPAAPPVAAYDEHLPGGRVETVALPDRAVA